MLVLTAREADKSTSTKHLIDWHNYKDFLHGFACQCYEKAKKDYKFFAIGYYGECYAGNDMNKFEAALKDPSLKAADCVGGGEFYACTEGHECSGIDNSEYIYRIKNKASAEQTINGGYSKWSEWSRCDKTCGNGIQARERSCTSPVPNSIGKDCSSLGESTETRSCKVKDCKQVDVGVCNVSPTNRNECGYPGISKETCESRGCCFDSSIVGVKWCFHKHSAEKPDSKPASKPVSKPGRCPNEISIDRNLALKKKTSQSSTYSSGGYTYASKLAVDGNESTQGNYGGCQHTDNTNNAWWKVDLELTAQVKTVKIFNRMDCCSDRLSNTNIYVQDGDKKQLCANTGDMNGVSMKVFECLGNGFKGNAVFIQKVGKGILSLCEVEVHGVQSKETVTNLSLKRATSQSSTYNAGGYTYPSKLAVDGNQGTSGNYGGCTHTYSNTPSWWKVALDSESEVYEVKVTNRMDCCSDRLSNAVIYVLSGDKKSICANVGDMKDTAVKTFKCAGGSIVGDAVMIQNDGYLSLCEVEVRGVSCV